MKIWSLLKAEEEAIRFFQVKRLVPKTKQLVNRHKIILYLLIKGLAGGVWERHVRNKLICMSIYSLIMAECHLFHLSVVLQMIIYGLLWIRARHFYKVVDKVLCFHHIFLYFNRIQHQRNRLYLDKDSWGWHYNRQVTNEILGLFSASHLCTILIDEV